MTMAPAEALAWMARHHVAARRERDGRVVLDTVPTGVKVPTGLTAALKRYNGDFPTFAPNGAAPAQADRKQARAREEMVRERVERADDLPFTPKITRLSDVEAEMVEWLWAGRIPLGKVTVLDGDPGLGKSSLLLDIAARVSTGRAMPDGTASDLDGPAGVVLMSAEDGLSDTIRPRLDAHYADTTRIVALECLIRGDEERSVTLADIPAIERGITVTGAKLVVVDPLMAYLDSDTNSYRDQDMRRILAPLARLAQRYGVAIVVIRHFSKGQTTNIIYRGGGSIGIIGAARVGLIVGKHPDDETDTKRVLAVAKNNLAPSAPSLGFHIAAAENGTARVVWDGTSPLTAAALLAIPEDRPDRNARAEAMDFLTTLLAGGAVAATNVKHEARAAGIADATLRRAKDALNVMAQRHGFGADGTWVWVLPEPSTAVQKPP